MRHKTTLVLKGLAILGLVFWLSRISFTQSPKRDRIAGPVAGSPAVWLKGNIRPMFQPENDQGPVADSLRLENISLMFKLTESQQADLRALLAEQQDPSSPNYHQWLTPEQYADRFGLSQSDINQVVAWLQSQGLRVTETARSRTWIKFSGTAAQVRATFQTEIHNFSYQGETYHGNSSEPAVPAALIDVVLGIHGLDNYPPKLRGVFRQVAPGPTALAEDGPNPNFTSSLSGNTFLTPGDFAVIYDVQNLYNAGIDGTGQSIAVMGETDIVMSDITAFRTASNLPPINLQVVVAGTDPGTSTNTGILDEAALDIEWSGGVAKNAKIFYVNSTDAIFGSLEYAIDHNTAQVLSVSYGDCEARSGSANLTALQNLATQANAQGQTIVAAAGDAGAADCDASNSTTPVTSATHGLAVDAPASVPYVTGMGGSEFNEGSGTYWQAATSATGDILTSALSYIPEMAWNDTASPVNTGNGLLAGGGGASAFFAKPSWQTGTGVPNDGHRDVPDLSFNASPAHDEYLICAQGSCVNGYRNTNQTLTVAGGTSAAAPTFAGIVALINQHTSTNWGNINTILYPMAGTSPAAFHDITTGNNMVPCTARSAGCPSGGEIGYTAIVGYDQATGLGSVDAYNLVIMWNSPGMGNLPAPNLTLPANGAASVPLSPTNFSWTAVTGNAGYRIMIATSPADLTSNPATSTCASCTIVDTTSQNAITYSPPSPLPEGVYYWQVQAIEPTSSTGVAAWSNVFTFATTGGTLTAPALTGPTNGATAVPVQATFTWSTVSGNSGYRIAIAMSQAALPTNPLAGSCTGCTVNASTVTASFVPAATSLSGGTTFYWEVQALASSGGGQNGPWSSAFSFTTVPVDFTLGVSPTTVTVAPGSSGTSTITFTYINNPSGLTAISWVCSVSSSLAGVTCALGTLPTNSMFGVTITASSSAGSYPAQPRSPRFGGWWLAGVAMLCLLLIALSRWRRGRAQAPLWNLRHAALGAVLAAILMASLSCGGGNTGSGGGGTPAGPESGTVTVTGTSSSTSHSVQVSVTVS